MNPATNIDFHCHTNASDGSLSPTELLALANERNIELLAITDHDTVAGFNEARTLDFENTRLISGIEFSATWQSRCVHIVGLDFDADNSDILDAIQSQKIARLQRGRKIAASLEQCGISDAFAGAMEFASDDNLSRVHFAEHLVKEGHAKDTKQAFKRYLGAGKRGDVRTDWLGMENVIARIKGAGGLSVLAHPDAYNFGASRIRTLVSDFMDFGGNAIEVSSGTQDEKTTRLLAKLAREFNCLASAGSDFHSPAQRWRNLGCYSPLPLDLAKVSDVVRERIRLRST